MIPVIDLAMATAGDCRLRNRMLRQLDQAARDLGFMQVQGHGINRRVLGALQDAMDGFFSLPLHEKQQWCAPSAEINRGYSGPLSERLSYSAGVLSAADLFEAFNLGASWKDFPGLDLDPLSYPENIWPNEPAHFRAGVEAWFAEAGALARRLTRLFALALDLPADYFAPFEDHSVDVLRLNHYALPAGPIELEPGQMGMGAHTDFGMVTVLWADPVWPGLQVQGADGVWIDVIPQPGALLVNLGDLMARWTNGRWTSSLHRVLPPIDQEGRVSRRRSAAYFHDGNADATISALPACCGFGMPAPLEPITVAEHLRRKLAGSRALQVNTAAQGESQRIRRGEESRQAGNGPTTINDPRESSQRLPHVRAAIDDPGESSQQLSHVRAAIDGSQESRGSRGRFQ